MQSFFSFFFVNVKMQQLSSRLQKSWEKSQPSWSTVLWLRPHGTWGRTFWPPPLMQVSPAVHNSAEHLTTQQLYYWDLSNILLQLQNPRLFFVSLCSADFFFLFYCRSGSTTSPVRCPGSWGRTWLWRMYHRSTSLWPSPSLWWRECVSRRRGCWGISSEPLCITSFTPGPGDSVKLGESQTVPKGLVLSTRVEIFRERTSTFA